MKENYIFYQMPKFLFSGETVLSSNAKLLYMFMLDRKKLSEINSDRFTDKDSKMFILFGYDEASRLLGCSKSSVTAYMNELKQAGLVQVVKHRFNEYRIYLNDEPGFNFTNTKITNTKKRDLRLPNFESCHTQCGERNNNKYVNNDYNKTYTQTKKKQDTPKPSYDLDKYTRRAFMNPMKIFEKEEERKKQEK